MRCAQALTALAGLEVRVTGGERLAGPGPRVIVCNHASYLDVVVLAAILPGEPYCVAKEELFRNPVFGPLVRGTGCYPVRGGDPRVALEDEARIEEGLRRSETAVYFPEGTFAVAAGLLPFGLGAFQGAVASRAEVVPMVLRGKRQALRDETWLPRPGRIDVEVGPPIRPEGEGWREVARLRDLARQWIDECCGD